MRYSIPTLLAALALGTATAHAAPYTLSGGGESQVVVNNPVSTTTLLGFFQLHYSSGFPNRDHEIEKVEIRSISGGTQTRVGFRDGNGDDHFTYSVRQHPVSDPRIIFSSRSNASSVNCVNRGRCTVAVNPPSGDYVFVLRGFELRFLNGDHELDRMAIYESNGTMTVAFNDRNDDDPFSYSVQYAWVPRDLLTSIVHSQGRDRAIGQFYAAGDIVIRGFDVDLVSDDHEVETFGVYRYSNNRVFVDNHDNGWDDSFDWGVDWAVLRNE